MATTKMTLVEMQRAYMRGLFTVDEMAEVMPFLCKRALWRADCPVGHDWGTDPALRLPVHVSARAHADALVWAAAEAEREAAAAHADALRACAVAAMEPDDETEPECCRQTGYVKAGTDGVARCGQCWEDLEFARWEAGDPEPETPAERKRAALHAMEGGYADPEDFANWQTRVQMADDAEARMAW